MTTQTNSLWLDALRGSAALRSSVRAVSGNLGGLTTVLSRLGTTVEQAFSGTAVEQFGKSSVTATQKLSAAEKTLARNTGKSAEAAARSLAAFDELQRLQSAAAGSGGSSAAGGKAKGSAAADKKESAAESKAAARVKALRALLDTLLAPLRQIDLTPLEQAFARLQQAAAPLTRTLFAGLEWLWYELLVPLAAWTAQQALPAFLDLLAAGCRLLNAALTALQPLAVWLWERFLQPLAAWTGGAILTVLGALTAALDTAAAWIAAHQEAFAAMVTVLGAFAAALGLVNAAAALWNTLCAAASAVTAAFGAATALLASPIGLAALAIGALIAVIVLLVTHWEQVQAAAASAWAGVQAGWSAAANWFAANVTQPLAALWNGFAAAVAGIWNGITATARGAVNGVIGLLNGMIAGIVAGVNAVIGMLNGLSVEIPAWVPGLGGSRFGFSLGTFSAPQIPYLAQGAVIPANHEFLAVLGDQSSGTNIEAPLATIEEAVANVMADLQAGQMAGLEAVVAVLREILEAVYGIELTDEMVGRAASRWQERRRIQTGGAV